MRVVSEEMRKSEGKELSAVREKAVVSKEDERSRYIVRVNYGVEEAV